MDKGDIIVDKLILEAWDKNNNLLKDYFRSTEQSEYNSYLALLKKTLEIIFEGNDEYEYPSLERITEINYGSYEGTLVYIIGNNGYAPTLDEHWYTSVEYGSCSACDTLLGINRYDDGLPNEEQVEKYWTLCLHLMQKMKRMEYI
jgi:hypothetical protein